MTTLTGPEAARVPDAAPSARPGRRIAHPVRWIAGVCLVALVVVAVVAATRPSQQATQVQSPLVGHRAPPLAGTDLEGAPYSLAAERGHWVYVNFFASWCPPCQQENSSLVRFYDARSSTATGVRMVGVVYNDTVSDAVRFVRDGGDRWPVVPDHGGAIANAFGVSSPPMTFLVDPEGTVVGTWEGPVTVAQLDQMLHLGLAGELGSGGTGSGSG